jgi:CBS domain-containing protein/sporulation protein YlmC with PRC-barrel domain
VTETASTEKADIPPLLVHLSSLIKRPLLDSDGDAIGRLQDLIVRVGERSHPPITGAVVRIEGRDLFVPVDKIAGIDRGKVIFDGSRLDLRRFERRPGELLLAHDLLARHIINMVGVRLVRANEIELAKVDGEWLVVGVDPSSRPVLRRLLPGHLSRAIRPGSVLDWESIEPFVSHVPSARLRIPYRKLARLHPAQIADIVEAASHEEGEEIIEAVQADRELEADVFEELDTEHQLEFVRTRSDVDAARLLARMAPDDAADLIMELDQERRLPVLGLLPAAQQRKVRSLLSYNPETAGGLMSPDFLALPESTSVADALSAIRHSTAPPESLNVVFTLDDSGSVSGSVSAVLLIRSDPASTLDRVARPNPAHVHADWDIHSVVRKMSDFNLTVAPVMDHDHSQILGVVTVDDVLEMLLPSGWRRDAGITAREE